jgi:hypothetical protein
MARPPIVHAILARLRNLSLLGQLAREAGWRHVLRLALFTLLNSLVEIGSLGLGLLLLLQGGSSLAARLPFHLHLSLPQDLLTLLGLMLVRGALQARINIGLEELRSSFGDQLRQRLLSHVLHDRSLSLQQLGRGVCRPRLWLPPFAGLPPRHGSECRHRSAAPLSGSPAQL